MPTIYLHENIMLEKREVLTTTKNDFILTTEFPASALVPRARFFFDKLLFDMTIESSYSFGNVTSPF